MQWNEEAEQILEERFGGDNEMALATCRDNMPSVRTVNATYWEGCFYVITYGLSRKMEEIRDNPIVALSGEWFTCHGTAESLGWFGREENRAVAAHLRKVFAGWIENGHNDFSNTNTIILRVRVTDAVLLSHGRRFEKTAAE